MTEISSKGDSSPLLLAGRLFATVSSHRSISDFQSCTKSHSWFHWAAGIFMFRWQTHFLHPTLSYWYCARQGKFLLV